VFVGHSSFPSAAAEDSVRQSIAIQLSEYMSLAGSNRVIDLFFIVGLNRDIPAIRSCIILVSLF